MHKARIDASALCFPETCANCDGPGEVAYGLDASRGFDLIFVSYHKVITLEVPLCRACRRRRRIVGAAIFFGSILLIFALGLLGTFLVIDLNAQAAGIALFVIVVAFAIIMRMRGDDIVEWRTLGLRVSWKKGPGQSIELRFRRPAYFLAWAAANPGAHIGG